MKTVICKQCGKETEKYNRGGSLFCNRSCYMDWKRENPNKKAYKEKILISGYFYIYMPSHPNAIKGGRYVAEHRLRLEEKIGRLLLDAEIAHHKNGDRLDNRHSNLELMTIGEHNSHHAKTRRRRKDGKF